MHLFVVADKSTPSKGAATAGEDEDAHSNARIALPKLVLALECWSLLTSRPDFVRHVYSQFDATPDRAKVRSSRW